MSDGGQVVADEEKNEIEYVDVSVDTEDLNMTRFRLKKIENLEALTNVKSLRLCWNLIKQIENLDTLTTLTQLELSDNQVSNLFSAFSLLRTSMQNICR